MVRRCWQGNTLPATEQGIPGATQGQRRSVQDCPSYLATPKSPNSPSHQEHRGSVSLLVPPGSGSQTRSDFGNQGEVLSNTGHAATGLMKEPAAGFLGETPVISHGAALNSYNGCGGSGRALAVPQPAEPERVRFVPCCPNSCSRSASLQVSDWGLVLLRLLVQHKEWMCNYINHASAPRAHLALLAGSASIPRICSLPAFIFQPDVPVPGRKPHTWQHLPTCSPGTPICSLVVPLPEENCCFSSPSGTVSRRPWDREGPLRDAHCTSGASGG